MSSVLFESPSYDPEQLLAFLSQALGVKNDAALARSMKVAPPVISKIRNRRLPVTAAVLIRMHEVSGIDIKQLRDIMGDHDEYFDISRIALRRKRCVIARSVEPKVTTPNPALGGVV